MKERESKGLNCAVLQICCNELSGNIPNQLGSLKKLTVLALQHNRLSGEIPMSLGSLEMLKRIYLSFNNFNGTIPIKIAAIPQLEVLDIRNNSLSGHVPSGNPSLSLFLLFYWFSFIEDIVGRNPALRFM